MKKALRPLGRKLHFTLPIMLVCLLVAGGTAYAQSASLTATVRINPLGVEISPIGTVLTKKWFEIPVVIFNLGSETITKTVATVHSSPKFTIKAKKERIGNLGPGMNKTIVWQARANRPGNFVVQVEVTGELAGEEISASDTINISPIGSLGAFFLRLIFGV